MRDNALSSIVGMLLVLAIISTFGHLFLLKYESAKRIGDEIESNQKFEHSFSSLSKCYVNGGFTEIYIGENPTVATFSVSQMGWVNITSDTFSTSFKLFAVKATIHNDYLPDKRYSITQSGIKVYQSGKNVTIHKFERSVEFNNNQLSAVIFNLTSTPFELSGTGIAFIQTVVDEQWENHTNLKNVTVEVKAEDPDFLKEWSDALGVQPYNGRVYADLGNINISLKVRNYQIWW